MTINTGPNLGLAVNGTAGEEHYSQLMRMWRGLDGLVQCHVLSRSIAYPPTITNGACYIIGEFASGAWTARTGQIARGYTLGDGSPAWDYFVPKTGWSALVNDELDINGAPIEYRYGASGWVKPDLGPTRAETIVNPMTEAGDIIYAGADGVPRRLAIGVDGQVLKVSGTALIWDDDQIGSPGNGSGGEGGGNMDNPMTASWDLIVGGPAGAPRRLAIGTEGYGLQIKDGAIVWAAMPEGTGGGMSNPMTTVSDIIVAGTDGLPTRLGRGEDGQILKMVGLSIQWANAAEGGAGGMVNPMTAPRDLIIGGTGGVPVRLANGSAGQLLSATGWITPVESVPASTLGVTVATLVGGKVPSSQLPSYVDDVIEYNTLSAMPRPGETGKIYVALNTNQQYRWPQDGADYVALVSSPGTTDAVTEGTVNKYWTAARTLATALTGLVTSSAVAVIATDTILQAIGKLQAQLTGKLDAAAAAASATKLATARTINGVSFDGTANISVTDTASLPKAGGNMTGAIGSAAPVTGVVSSGTLDLSAINANLVLVGGTDAIGYLGFGRIGDTRTVISTGTPLFYNGTNLVLPGGKDVQCAVGDSLDFVCIEAGIWRCTRVGRVGKVNTAARLLTPATSSATALSSITDLSVDLDASSTYEFHAEVSFMTAAATTGAAIGWLAPSGSDCLGRITVPITTGQGTNALSKPGQTTSLSVVGTGTAAGQGHVAQVSGIVTTTTAGTFAIQFASSVASSLTTIQYGSILSMRKIG